jgi:hypothetical protein
VTDWLTQATAIGVYPLAVPGGGWSSDGDAYTVAGVSRPAPTGPPVLTSLNPTEYVVGSPSVVLHCIGTGFTRDCFIAFAGQAERTDFHSDTDVSTVIDGKLWTGADTVAVSVVSQSRGGSKPQTFDIAAS